MDKHIVQQRGGLSPRVRGNPPRLTSTPSATGVYPRVCGGTLGRAVDILPAAGLSPRVRGNQP